MELIAVTLVPYNRYNGYAIQIIDFIIIKKKNNVRVNIFITNSSTLIIIKIFTYNSSLM